MTIDRMTTVRYPSQEEIRWHMQQSARMRSEAVHELLHRAAAWVGGGALIEPGPGGRYVIPQYPRGA